MTDKTAKKQPDHLFKPGQSGNPAGRPKGSRNRLSEEFIAAMCADFDEHGEAVIATVRMESPVDYVKVIASIIPKQVTVKDLSLDDMSDHEIADALAAINTIAALSGATKARGRTVEAASSQASNGARRVN